MKYTKESKVNHHLLEEILWPLADGTFKHIRNSASRLQELGIYTVKLTIEMNRSAHMSLHQKGKPKTEAEKIKNSQIKKGKVFSEEHIKHLRESHLGKTSARKGVAMSEEQKMKIRNAASGKHRVYREDGSYYLAKEAK